MSVCLKTKGWKTAYSSITWKRLYSAYRLMATSMCQVLHLKESNLLKDATSWETHYSSSAKEMSINWRGWARQNLKPLSSVSRTHLMPKRSRASNRSISERFSKKTQSYSCQKVNTSCTISWLWTGIQMKSCSVRFVVNPTGSKIRLCLKNNLISTFKIGLIETI